MKWQEFSRFIPQNNYVNASSSRNCISQLISHRGQVDTVPNDKHKWYPKGILNAEYFHGHRYVDMHHSYFGEDALLISEANCCVIFLLIDSHSNTKFAAHIAACSDLKSTCWVNMAFDLECFFEKVRYDFNHIECYCFSNQHYKNATGSFEQRNLMRLLSCLKNNHLEQIAKNTRLIEGENGRIWNHHCAVRVSAQQKQTLNISFTHAL